MPIVNYPFVVMSGIGVPKPGLPVILTNPANGFSLDTWALIDTGADSTVIPEFIAKKLRKYVLDAQGVGLTKTTQNFKVVGSYFWRSGKFVQMGH